MRTYNEINEQKKVWSELAQYIGGEFLKLNTSRRFAIVYKHYDWRIVMYNDEKDLSGVFSTTTIQTVYENKTPFVCKFEETNTPKLINNLLRRQDLEIGDRKIDDACLISSNNKAVLQQLFSTQDIRQLMRLIYSFNVTIENNTKVSSFLNTNDSMKIISTFNDILLYPKQMFYLFKLYTLLLDRLVNIGVAHRKAPAFNIISSIQKVIKNRNQLNIIR